MTTIRIRTVEEPFDDPDTVRSAVSFLSRADTMGFLGDEDIDRLGVSTVREVIDAMTDAGLGAGPGAVLHVAENEISGADIAEVLKQLDSILESSPAPDNEWPVVEDLFGIDTLAKLLEVSPASVRRYLRRDRTTPDQIAARLHFLAMVVSDLSGAYNDFGIRRWFGRSRQALDGAAPRELLTDNWDPDDPGPQRVRALARALLGSSVT
jgi:FAD/FMN-containing dehydrogenase